MNLLQNFVNSIEASHQAAAFSAAGADSAAFMRTGGFANQPMSAAAAASVTTASFPGCFYIEKLKGFEMAGPGRMTDEAHQQPTLAPTSSAHGVVKTQARQRTDESKADMYEAREAGGYGEMMNAASAAAAMLANSEHNKRMRNMFSMSQIDVLERIFEQTHYPDSAIREQLSKSLNLSVVRIQVWFQNRRAKFRKLDSLPRGSGASKALSRKQQASGLDSAGFRSESKSVKESVRSAGSSQVENKRSDAFSVGPLHLDFAPSQASYQMPSESLSAAELLSSMTVGRSGALFGGYFGAGGLYQHQTRPLTVHADSAGQQFGAHFDQQTPYAAFHHHHHNHGGHQTQLQFDQTNDCHN